METFASAAVLGLSVYAALGVAFAIPFVIWGVKRIDPAAREGTWGFRLLILPGCAALWPLLLRRVVGGLPPPEERTAHRLRASQSTVARGEKATR